MTAVTRAAAGAFTRLRRVALFRALMLGDMLCAVPAMRALRHACPEAEITLVGLPWAREWAQRLPHVDRFVEFPGYPGLPEILPDLDALPGFLRRMQDEGFELLVQLHGSGGIVNPLLAACAPERLAGFALPGAFGADSPLFAPWPCAGHEIERLLTLTDHLGMPRRGSALEHRVTDSDRIELATLWPPAFGGDGFVCLHAGAPLASQRWPLERFAQVADALAARGSTIVLTGTAGEAALAASLQQAMRHPAVNLVGRTSLWTLGALLERTRLLVSNATGVAHMAQALHTPSIVVAQGEDAARWVPPETPRHRLAGQPAGAAPARAVIAAAQAMLHRASDRRARPRAEDRPLTAIVAAPRADETPQLRDDESPPDWSAALPTPAPAPPARARAPRAHRPRV